MINRIIETVIKGLFLGVIFWCGYFYRYNTENRAWLANKAHVNITLMDLNLRPTFYDSAHTVPMVIDGKNHRQIDTMRNILDTLKVMFPVDTIIPCRIVRGDKYSRAWVDSVMKEIDKTLARKDSAGE